LNEEPKTAAELHEDVPENLQQIVQKTMAKNLHERYQNVGEVLADLESSGSGEPSADIKSVGAGFKPAPTRELGILIGGLAVLALLVVAAFFMFKTSPAETKDKKSIAVLPFENLSGKQERVISYTTPRNGMKTKATRRVGNRFMIGKTGFYA